MIVVTCCTENSVDQDLLHLTSADLDIHVFRAVRSKTSITRDNSFLASSDLSSVDNLCKQFGHRS